MKTFFLVCLAVLAVANAKYTDKFDGIDVEEIASNCRLLVPYFKCLVGEQKKCTKEGLELKKHVADALKTKCTECTDKQKEVTQHIIGLAVNKHKAAWEKLKALYDPNNEYVTKYQDELNKAVAAGNFDAYPECDYETERPIA